MRSKVEFALGLGAGFGIGLLIAPAKAVRARRRAFTRLRERTRAVRDAVLAVETLFETVPPPASATTQQQAAAREKQFLNFAGREELLAVNGIEAATAERIMNHRPYSSLDDLRARVLVPPSVYEELKRALARRIA
jgi:DNA uptake protein ComE-like DNA-binding protein